MNRTIKEATVKRYHYDSHQQLEAHLTDFINAYNYGRRLKTLKGLTPYEYVCKIWKTEPKQILQNQPAPSNAGTKHLGRALNARARQRQRPGPAWRGGRTRHNGLFGDALPWLKDR